MLWRRIWQTFPLYRKYTDAFLHVNIREWTCDEGRHSPANQVVEPHGSVVDVSHFADHAIDMQPLQEEPGERAEVEEVQQDGDDCAQKLQQAAKEKERDD